MTGLLGVCGLVIDVGNLYEQHHQTQAAADAATGAGADAIPSASWQSAARMYAAKNDEQGDQVSVSYNATDSVTVTVTRQAPTYVAKLFGFSTAKVVSSATATIQAVAQVNGHIASYAVTTQVYANGSGTVLFNENAPGAYGTIDLPATDNTSGGSCSANTIPGTSPNIKAMLGDTLAAGQLVVGGCLSVKSGAAQPSADVINNLPGSLNADLQPLGNGLYQVIPQSWDDTNHLPPRLLFVPIVDTVPGGNGSTTVKQSHQTPYRPADRDRKEATRAGPVTRGRGFDFRAPLLHVTGASRSSRGRLTSAAADSACCLAGGAQEATY